MLFGAFGRKRTGREIIAGTIGRFITARRELEEGVKTVLTEIKAHRGEIESLTQKIGDMTRHHEMATNVIAAIDAMLGPPKQ